MPTTTCLPAQTLKALQKYDTPTICNVIELFDVRPRTAGYMDDTIRACFPKMPPMVGYALTVKFGAADANPPRPVYDSLAEQAKTLQQLGGPGVIVFEDTDDPTVAATFGEVMCTTYKAFGAAGLITSGAGRDLDQVEAIGFPVFTNGTICAHGYCTMIELNVPVNVGGITINPGDLLHGDLNGVTTVPHEFAADLPDLCEKFMAAEKVTLDYVTGPNITIDGFLESGAEQRRMIKAIADSLK